MIVAVPRQVAVWAADIGQVVLTDWLWRCSECQVESLQRWSHADLALRMGELHAEREQCHVSGQLALFGVAA